MANLSTDQINELKNKGIITQVIPSASLVDNTVDDLKIDELVTITVPSEDIEASVTTDNPISQ